LKIMGLSMFAGVTWVQAVLRLQHKGSDEKTESS
jgi:hypothetical protein